MHRKVYCPRDSDFKSYYSNQGGSGFGDIRIVRAPRFQSGYGVGSFFTRLAMPLIKYIGKEALNKGVTIGKRVVTDPQIQQAFKESVADLANKSLTAIKQKVERQQGSGRKRLYKKRRQSMRKKTLRKVKRATLKRVTKRKVKKVKRRKRDVFK